MQYHRSKPCKNVRQPLSNCAIAGVDPEAPAQADNGRPAGLVRYLSDFLGMILLSAGRHAVSLRGFSGELRWVMCRDLHRGARLFALLMVYLTVV
jgi:hypothetical protein